MARRPRWPAWCWGGAIVLGATQAIYTADRLADPDVIAYLDIADAYRLHDWPVALSRMWPPLYSWLLALALAILRPSPAWELSVVRLVNFVTYLAALGAFGFLLAQVIGRRRQRQPEVDADAERIWGPVGVSLLSWSCLTLITIREDSPDMLVAALFFLAAGLLLRIQMGRGTWPAFLALGVVLGAAYLAKTFFFYLAIVTLGIAWMVSGRSPGRTARALAACALFVLISGAYTVALSLQHGRLVLREGGELTYAFVVQRVPWVHWQGQVAGAGTPVHPTRRIHEDPAVYEFATPIGGTYPPWHDPAYWNEGVRVRPSVAGQLAAVARGLRLYVQVFLVSGGVLLAGALGLASLVEGGWRAAGRRLGAWWVLLLPPLAAMGGLPFVLVESTHIGGFVVVFWLAVFAALLPGSPDPAAKASRAILAVVAATLALQTVASVAVEATHTAGDLARGRYPWPYDQGQVAQALQEGGLRPGQRVAVIGDGFTNAWARIARVRIVAEVPPDEAPRYWTASEPTRVEILARLAALDVAAVVAIDGPPSLTAPWRAIGRTGHYVRFLSGG